MVGLPSPADTTVLSPAHPATGSVTVVVALVTEGVTAAKSTEAAGVSVPAAT